MTIYADFDYYSDTYGGTEISKDDFTRLIRQASAYLDMVTFGRIDDVWSEDDRVKDCACAVAEYCKRRSEMEDGSAVSSLSIGEETVSYALPEAYTNPESFRKAITTDVIRMYLGNTGLLYRGVDDEN